MHKVTWGYPQYLATVSRNNSLVMQCCRELERWVRCSGVEWTVARLKDFKSWRLQSISDPNYSLPFYSKREKNGITRPKGPFGAVWDIGLIEAIDILSVYLTFSLTEASSKQKEKFYGGVNHLSTGITPPVSVPFGDPRYEHIVVVPKIQMDLASDMVKWTSTSRRCPTMDQTGKVRSKEEKGTSYAEHMRYLYLFPENDPILRVMARESVFTGMDNLSFRMIPMMINQARMFPIFSPNIGWSAIPPLPSQGTVPFHVGKISYIQEPGCKLRAIANPARIWQGLLSRLGTHLYGCLSTIPEDCTFDQEKGVLRVQQWLREGSTLYSVDISDATSTFPRSFTLDVLRKMVHQENHWMIDVFDHISKSPWLTPEGTYVQFKTGQPLGSYPSFAAFALSHHSLLRYIKPLDYVILGDDIVIRGELGKGEKYLETLKSMGVPISRNKTIVSDKVAEFAGCTITSSSIRYPKKWRKVTTNNFMDLALNFGPSILEFFPGYLRYLAREVSEVPTPYGLGWNPKGIPWDIRIQGLEDLILRPSIIPLPDDTGTHLFSEMEKISFREVLSHNLPGGSVYNWSAIEPETDQASDPSISFLQNLASQNIPINRNVEEMQGLRPPITASRGKFFFQDTYVFRMVLRYIFPENKTEFEKFVLSRMVEGTHRERSPGNLAKQIRGIVRLRSLSRI